MRIQDLGLDIKTVQNKIDCFANHLDHRGKKPEFGYLARPHKDFDTWFNKCPKMQHSGNFYDVKQLLGCQKEKPESSNHHRLQ